MKNRDIADIFAEIADLMEILGENPFRINSYRKAARIIEEMPGAIEDIAASGRLRDIPGVGAGIAGVIEDYLATGQVAVRQALAAQVPPKLPELLTVPSLGPKTVAKLWRQANVKSIAELRRAVGRSPQRLVKLEGFGPKKVSQIAEALAFMQSAAGRIRLDEAERLAESLIDTIRRSKGARKVTPAGSLRRGSQTVGDIDILCQGSKAAAGRIIEEFTRTDGVRQVLARGRTKGSVVLADGVQADLRVVEAKSFAAALMYFTGSKAHNVRLRELAVKRKLKLNEYGLFDGRKQIAGAGREEDIYAALQLAYIEPELREDRGEVAAAADDTLPKLLAAGDIRGDLHIHTHASDGADSIEEMVLACRKLGYKYLCISDHSQSQVQAGGLDKRRLAEQVRQIRKVNEQLTDILVLAGCEVDVFKDGALDFETDVLAELDFVTASPHSALSLKRPEATKRLIRAIEHPHVHSIGHPTGRLIGRRAGMELDIEAVAAAAAANDVALEINAHPMRLDLRDVHVRAAVAAGAKLVINTDAHSIAELALMRYGVVTARRGWAAAADVVNTYTPAKLKKWLKKQHKQKS